MAYEMGENIGKNKLIEYTAVSKIVSK